MAHSSNPFLDWLPKIIADPILVHDDTNEEAHTNHWAMGISEDDAPLLPADIVAYVDAVIRAREKQIIEQHNGHPMVLYCWHSVQTAQFNFSLISQSYGRLPFGAQREVVENVEEIAHEFLKNSYHQGIPLQEFRIVTEDDLDKEYPPYVLKVWSIDLPRPSATLTP